MNDLKYFNQSFIVRQGSDSDTSGNKVEFEGEISNTKTDSYYTSMSESALRSYAKNAKQGVPILPEHKMSGQPIGRSTGGSYNSQSQSVRAKFYIQRGLKLNNAGYADTDSYIESMSEGTTRDLSIGAKVEKETCDFCGLDMKRYNFFGLTFSEDENGHYPGQKIFINRKNQQVKKQEKGLKELTITSTIQKADLKEFSTVTFGANPDTQVVRQAKEALEQGHLEEKHLHQLSLNYNITRSDLDASPEPISSRVNNSRGDRHMDNDKDLNQSEIIQLKEENVKYRKDLEQANKLRDEFQKRYETECLRTQELEGNVSELEQIEELYHKQVNTIEDRDKEIEELQARMVNVRHAESKSKRYDSLCGLAREEVIEQYIRANSKDSTPEMIERKRKQIDAIEDYDQLKSWAAMYRDDARRLILKENRTALGVSKSEESEIDLSRFQ